MGALLLPGGILGIVIYLWLLFFSPYDLLMLKLTAAVAIASVFGIPIFIGYAMATTPSVMPVESHDMKGASSNPETKKE